MIKWFEKHKELSWIITILIAVIIFYLSTLSFGKGFGGGLYITNWRSIVYHIVIFFALSLFFFISLLQGKENYKLFLFSILILISYAILDEIHQFFVIGRFCTISDVGLDIIGILFAFMVYLISLKLR
jgi:VanZ family protein